MQKSHLNKGCAEKILCGHYTRRKQPYSGEHSKKMSTRTETGSKRLFWVRHRNNNRSRFRKAEANTLHKSESEHDTTT